MTEHEALIEAILDEPEDDARRLVYADWLEENGSFADGIRAQLLRLQVQEHRVRFPDPRWIQLRDQMNPLERRYSWLMIPALPPGFERPSLVRGLIEINVSTTVPRFIDWGEDYRRGLPPYCRLRLKLSRLPARGKLLTLLDSAAWPLVLELPVNGYNWRESEFERLAADPRIGSLEELFLWGGSEIGDAALAALAGSPHFHRLRNLTLYGDPISDDGLVCLASVKGMPRLRLLRIPEKPAGTQGRRALRERRPELELFWPDS